jgi:hypothetical protein
MNLNGLNWRERLFVIHFLGDCKGDAERAAGWAGYGRTKHRVATLLARPAVREAIEGALHRAGLSAEQALALLANIATADLADFGDVDADGFRLNLAKAKARGKLHCIRKIRPVQVRAGRGDDGRKRYITDYELELHSPYPALELTGKALGLWRSERPGDDGTAATPQQSATDPALIAKLRETMARHQDEVDGIGHDDPPDD